MLQFNTNNTVIKYNKEFNKTFNFNIPIVNLAYI